LQSGIRVLEYCVGRHPSPWRPSLRVFLGSSFFVPDIQYKQMQMTQITSPTARSPQTAMSPKSTSSKTRLDTLLSMPKRLLSHKHTNTTATANVNAKTTSRERIKRAELRIQVITQPRMRPALREMPRSATRVLTILYEALTQAKNCEVGASSPSSLASSCVEGER
jgi:hypothetical protein